MYICMCIVYSMPDADRELEYQTDISIFNIYYSTPVK